ncbi:DUF917 domain-containing protein [Lentzea sp. NBRC 105346]|uniref:DUF917 domain-containing protein n=1 Tax=Lentzea sp. NBRC 105346 TaxID=3032205 RepID=UPI00255442F5|nr:DUF917 domain-containing protein [Lentzea sp. NBRC 105346]
MRLITPDDVDRLAVGVIMLGSGGGGGEQDVHVVTTMLRHAIRTNGPVRVLDVEEIDPDALGVRAGLIGAPTVMIEKLPSGNEAAEALRAVRPEGEPPVSAVIGWEIGGCNGLFPLLLAAQLGLPYVDVDGMGRAFPRIDQTTYDAAGLPITPLAITEPSGNRALLDSSAIEKLARTVMVDFGGWAMMVARPLRIGDAAKAGIPGTLARALELGGIWASPQESHGTRGRAEASGGFLVARGKVVEVWRESTGEFPRGTVAVRRLDEDDSYVRLEMQGEYLVVLADGEPLVTTPDLICCLDAESGRAIGTERLSYGTVIDIVALPAPPQWVRPRMLGRVDPRAFGYDLDYLPFGQS